MRGGEAQGQAWQVDQVELDILCDSNEAHASLPRLLDSVFRCCSRLRQALLTHAQHYGCIHASCQRAMLTRAASLMFQSGMMQTSISASLTAQAAQQASQRGHHQGAGGGRHSARQAAEPHAGGPHEAGGQQGSMSEGCAVVHTVVADTTNNKHSVYMPAAQLTAFASKLVYRACCFSVVLHATLTSCCMLTAADRFLPPACRRLASTPWCWQATSWTTPA